MDAGLENYIVRPRISSARREIAYVQVQKVAKEAGLQAPNADIAAGLAQEKVVRDLNEAWARTPRNKTNKPLYLLDKRVDAILMASRRMPEVATAGLEPNDPDLLDADRLIKAFYPPDMKSLIQLPYPEELVAVERMLVKAKDPEWAPLVLKFGMKPHFNRLTPMMKEYRHLVETLPPTALQFKTVEAARSLAHNYMLQAIVTILHTYRAATPEHAAHRQRLLEPFERQFEETRLARGRVEPGTGEPDEEELDGGGTPDEPPAAPEA